MGAPSNVRYGAHIEGQGGYPSDPRWRVGAGRYYTAKEAIDPNTRYEGMPTIDDAGKLWMLIGGKDDGDYVDVFATFQLLAGKDVAGGYAGIDGVSGKISTQFIPIVSSIENKSWLGNLADGNNRFHLAAEEEDIEEIIFFTEGGVPQHSGVHFNVDPNKRYIEFTEVPDPTKTYYLKYLSNLPNVSLLSVAVANVVGLLINGKVDPALISLLDEDDFISDSNTHPATQQSIKAFINAFCALLTGASFTGDIHVDGDIYLPTTKKLILDNGHGDNTYWTAVNDIIRGFCGGSISAEFKLSEANFPAVVTGQPGTADHHFTTVGQSVVAHSPTVVVDNASVTLDCLSKQKRLFSWESGNASTALTITNILDGTSCEIKNLKILSTAIYTYSIDSPGLTVSVMGKETALNDLVISDGVANDKYIIKISRSGTELMVEISEKFK